MSATSPRAVPQPGGLPTDRSQFEKLWEGALERYTAETGRDLSRLPYFDHLRSYKSVDDVLAVLEKQGKSFKEYRADGATIRRYMHPFVRFLQLFVDTGGEVAAASNGVVPGGKAIFTAFAVLLQATKGVTQVYEALEALSTRLQKFLDRLAIHFEAPSEPIPALQAIFAKTLVQILHIFAIYTKYVDREVSKISAVRLSVRRFAGRIKDYGKVLLGDSTIQGALEKLDELTKDEHLMTAAETLVGVRKIQKDVGEILVKLDDEDTRRAFKDIEDWLQPPNHAYNHELLKQRRLKGSGQWFVQDEMFRSWRTSERGMYWVYGKPGGGKSILCSFVVDALSTDTSSVLYFYFDYRDSEKRTTGKFLSSLVFQLASRSGKCFEFLRHTRSTAEGRLPPTNNMLFDCLKNMLRLSTTTGTYLVLDALDEVPEDERENGLFLYLQQLVGLDVDGLHFLIFSRLEQDISYYMKKHPPTHTLELSSAEGPVEDLRRYISEEFSHQRYRDKGWSEEIKERAQTLLGEKANGMFLWVKLQIDGLRRCSAEDVGKVLDSLPRDLDETYERILMNFGTNPDIMHRIRRVFESIVFAKYPLSPADVAEIYDTNPDTDDIADDSTTASSDRDPEAYLLANLPRLIQFVDGWNGKAVRFIHFSVQEYFIQSLAKSDSPVSSYGFDSDSAHITLAKMCIGALDPDIGTRRPCLKRYAELHWFDHIIPGPVSEALDELLSRFLHPKSRSFVLWASSRPWLDSSDRPDTALHWAARFGLTRRAEALIDTGAIPVDAPDSEGMPPLFRAAYDEHLDTVRLLLDKGANVGAVLESDNTTVLHNAIGGNKKSVIELLIARGAQVDALSRDGFTPLHEAARSGYAEAASTLLDHGADILALADGQTPLHRAVRYNKDELARLLLSRGAPPDYCDTDSGLTALHYAAAYGFQASARALLQSGASVHSRCARSGIPPCRRMFSGVDSGWTPLHCAVECGRAEIIPILLEYGVLDDADVGGRTPLHIAARLGHTEILALLLKGGAAVGERSKVGWTPLHYAAWGGSSQAVNILLQHGALVTDSDTRGLTPLHGAAYLERLETARALLKHAAPNAGDGVANVRDAAGQTPLHYAARCGHVYEEAFSKPPDDSARWRLLDDLLSETHGDSSVPLSEYIADSLIINYTKPAKTKRRGFRGTARVVRDHIALATFLLESGADPDAHTQKGKTALSYAASAGHAGFCRVLLDGGANVMVVDANGLCPLDDAVAGGHADVVGLLLERGADGRALQADTVRLLLERGADLREDQPKSMRSMFERTNDLWALRAHANIVRLLLERGVNLRTHQADTERSPSETDSQPAIGAGGVSGRCRSSARGRERYAGRLEPARALSEKPSHSAGRRFLETTLRY